MVISIIGLLSAISTVNLKSSQNAAKITKARADLKQLATAIDLARQNSNTYLRYITGTNCAYCYYCPSGDFRNIAESSTCAQGMLGVLNAIYAAAGQPAAVKVMRDPWGSPYQMDENEAETAGPDVIWSVGPDGSHNGGDDIILSLPKFGT